jgi:phage recombination protein Bet
MSAQVGVAGRNGDRRMSPDEYFRAVKLTMKKRVKEGGAWVDADPTDGEVNFLLIKAAEYGLNPLKGQIYATWRGGTIQVETTLDGLRVLAERTGEYRGQTPPEWFDGIRWTDVWIDDKEQQPVAARVGIRREGFPDPVFVTVHWREFKQTNRKGELSEVWKEKPAHMLAKTSASLGFRAAFPGEAGGIYTAEEMALIGKPDSGGNGAGTVHAEPAPAAGNGAATGANGGPRQTPPVSPPAEGNGAEPAAIVDPPAQQPSGPPATPGTSGRLSAVLEQAGYSKLREDLARVTFDQQANRLNEEQVARLANALTAAEAAGITAVELERACKNGLKVGDVALRRKRLFQWIAERAQRAGNEIPSRNGGQGSAGPSENGAGDATEAAQSDTPPDADAQATEAAERDTPGGDAPSGESSEQGGGGSNGSAGVSAPPDEATAGGPPEAPLPDPDAGGGPAATVDFEASEESQ